MPADGSISTVIPAFCKTSQERGVKATHRSPGKVSRGTPTELVKMDPSKKDAVQLEDARDSIMIAFRSDGSKIAGLRQLERFTKDALRFEAERSILNGH